MTKKKMVPVSLPKDESEVDELLGQLSEVLTTIDGIAVKLNEGVAKLHARASEQAKPYAQRVQMIFKALEAYGVINRSSLLKGKEKSAKFPRGQIGWRDGRLRVDLRAPEKNIIRSLRNAGLDEFIETKEWVNKAKMHLKENIGKLSGVPDIVIQEGDEYFFVRPLQLEAVQARMLAKRTNVIEQAKKASKKDGNTDKDE